MALNSKETPIFHNSSFFTKAEFTWTGKIELGPIRNQKRCNCCWACAAADCTQSSYNSLHDDAVVLSAQEIIDCYICRYPKTVIQDEVRCYRNGLAEGCRYIRDYGVCEEEHYPFKAERGDCLAEELTVRKMKIASFQTYGKDTDEDIVLDAIIVQPIVGGMEIPGNVKVFSKIKKDIYTRPEQEEQVESSRIPRHTVVVVGFGEEDEISYYLVKNSWSSRWGYHGYGKIARDLFTGFAVPVSPFFPEDAN